MLNTCPSAKTRPCAATCGASAGFCVSAQETRAALCARKGAIRRILPEYAGECAGIGAPYAVGCGSYQGARIAAPCRPWPVKRPYCGVSAPASGMRFVAPLPDSALRDGARAMVRALSGAVAESVGATDTPKISPARLRRLKRREKARRLNGDAATQKEAVFNRAESARRAFAESQGATSSAVSIETVRAGAPTCAPEPTVVTDPAARLAAIDAAENAILRVRASKRNAWIDAGGWHDAPLADLAVAARTPWVRDLARTMYAQIEAERQITAGSYRAPVVVTDDTRETHYRDVSWQSTAEIRPALADTRLTGDLDSRAKPWERDRQIAQDAQDAATAFAVNYGERPDPATISREIAARKIEEARENARIADARAKARTLRAMPRAPECAGRAFASDPAPKRERVRIIEGTAKDGRPATTVI